MVSNSISPNSDWQVTIGFYTAVHIINAHLATFNLHYQTHESVKNAISPFGNIESLRVPEGIYKAYVKLQSLSRRARYLVNDSTSENSEASFIHAIHLARALRHLDTIMQYFCGKYPAQFDKIHIKCCELTQNENLRHYILLH
ncbi:hypothetical protein SAMN04487996_109107 [Dyadobacter soli]|uniref:HEPN domain-containing protein n=2 Tax=Dyadobacter soli TaxID=659014 RepID=A0A1G7IWC8_9BACT|nr:hypothetical protein SAMN04487996_109107 [Dyadobacter soli]